MGRAADDTAVGMSLWLMPESGVGDRLRVLIEGLARRHRTPSFPPHLTLLGGIPGPEEDALSRVAGLARGLGPIAIRLVDVETSDEYFRCVFVRAEPTEALRAAHVGARAAFANVASTPFRPHLSLLYGRLEPPERAAVLQELGGTLELAFEASRLHVFRTQGPPRDWRPRGAFPLGG
ncbi:MAG TPA: 2'-5' RNA ligase family protein [Vicinamibacteria bacterium]|jgi:2'-5' RNA ligase|nr:2'-5' RNA ligase family protein [Vicinamibacteria bacterium]